MMLGFGHHRRIVSYAQTIQAREVIFTSKTAESRLAYLYSGNVGYVRIAEGLVIRPGLYVGEIQ